LYPNFRCIFNGEVTALPVQVSLHKRVLFNHYNVSAKVANINIQLYLKEANEFVCVAHWLVICASIFLLKTVVTVCAKYLDVVYNYTYICDWRHSLLAYLLSV
jgi:hypothetical protein